MMHTISPRAFGVVGDGVTDNAEPLIAMRDFMLRDPNAKYVVEFEHGQYDYSNNRWLRNLPYIEVRGNNSSFRNIANGKPFYIDMNPLLIAGLFTDYGDTDFPGDADAFQEGYRIDEVAETSSSLKLKTQGDVQFFSVGEWVCVHGFVQQFDGIPPNLRYFEYHKVDALDAANGTLTLNGVLKYSYSEKWYEFTNPGIYSVGLPRVVSLKTQSATVPKQLHLFDMEFLPNPTQPSFVNGFSLSGIDVYIENVTTPLAIWPTTSKSFVAKSCHFDSVEVDKLVSFIEIDGCDVSGEITGGTGAIDTKIDRCVVEKFIRYSPINNLLVENCTIIDKDNNGYAAVQDYYQAFCSRLVIVNSNKLGVNFRGPIASSGVLNFVVSEINVGQNILFLDDDDGRYAIRTLQVGSAIYLDQELTNISGVVTDIYFENNKHVVAGNFQYLVVGETAYYDVWHQTETSGNWHLGALEETNN